jgi:hypothetical protein
MGFGLVVITNQSGVGEDFSVKPGCERFMSKCGRCSRRKGLGSMVFIFVPTNRTMAVRVESPASCVKRTDAEQTATGKRKYPRRAVALARNSRMSGPSVGCSRGFNHISFLPTGEIRSQAGYGGAGNATAQSLGHR